MHPGSIPRTNVNEVFSLSTWSVYQEQQRTVIYTGGDKKHAFTTTK